MIDPSDVFVGGPSCVLHECLIPASAVPTAQNRPDFTSTNARSGGLHLLATWDAAPAPSGGAEFADQITVEEHQWNRRHRSPHSRGIQEMPGLGHRGAGNQTVGLEHETCRVVIERLVSSAFLR